MTNSRSYQKCPTIQLPIWPPFLASQDGSSALPRASDHRLPRLFFKFQVKQLQEPLRRGTDSLQYKFSATPTPSHLTASPTRYLWSPLGENPPFSSSCLRPPTSTWRTNQDGWTYSTPCWSNHTTPDGGTTHGTEMNVLTLGTWPTEALISRAGRRYTSTRGVSPTSPRKPP